MRTRRFVIFVGDTPARVGIVNPDGSSSMLETGDSETSSTPVLVDGLAEILREQGYRGEGCGLAVPSSWCLCAPISLEGLPRRKAREAMKYRLEEQLPIPAEDFVADFIVGSGSALGVCVPAARLVPIVEAMQARDIAVEWICPAALLAVQNHEPVLRGEAADALVWGCREHLEVFVFAEGPLEAWHTLPPNADDLLLYLRVTRARRGVDLLRVATCNVDREILAQIDGEPHLTRVRADEKPLLQEALAAAASSLDGRASPPINLRREALADPDVFRPYRAPFVAATAAALLLLVCSAGAMLWRADRYERSAADLRAQQESLFRELFPGQAPPASVRSRLASEVQRLSRPEGEMPGGLPATSALVLLKDTLAGLPATARYRVDEIRLADGQLRLEGQAGSHSDINQIVDSLRQHSRLSIEPLRVEQLASQWVAYTVIGSYAGGDSDWEIDEQATGEYPR